MIQPIRPYVARVTADIDEINNAWCRSAYINFRQGLYDSAIPAPDKDGATFRCESALVEFASWDRGPSVTLFDGQNTLRISYHWGDDRPSTLDTLVTLSELAIARTFGFPDEREVA